MQKVVRKLISLALTLVFVLSIVSPAFAAQKITNPHIRGGIDGIDADPTVGHHNSYAWCSVVFEQTDADYLWVGSNRDLGASVYSNVDSFVPSTVFGIPEPSEDYMGKIYRQRVSDPDAKWELMYESPAITGYRRMIVYNEELFVFAGLTRIRNVNYSFILRFSKDFKQGDIPEIVIWENLQGLSNEYFRSTTIFNDLLYVGTFDSKIYKTDAAGLQNLVPNRGPKSTGWELAVDLKDYSNVSAGSIWDLMAFNGSIYAFCSYGLTGSGFGVIKITPNGSGYAVEQIVGGSEAKYPFGMGVKTLGSASPFVTTLFEKDYVYVTTLSGGRLFLQGLGSGLIKETMDNLYAPTHVFRFDANDNWETVVGDKTGAYVAVDNTGTPLKHVGNQRAGFYLQDEDVANSSSNLYTWWMGEHKGKLYAATWDMGVLRDHFLLANLALLNRLSGGAVAAVMPYIEDLTEILDAIFEDAASVDFEAYLADLDEYLQEVLAIINGGGEIEPSAIIEEFINITLNYFPAENLAELRDLLLELISEIKALNLDVNAIITEYIAEMTGNIAFYLDRSNPAGFDLYVTEDGKNFEPITVNGFGDAYNYGGRIIVPSDYGLFVGTANPFQGNQVWRVDPIEFEMYLNGPHKAVLGADCTAVVTVRVNDAPGGSMLKLEYDSALVKVELIKRGDTRFLKDIWWDNAIETRLESNRKYYNVTEHERDYKVDMYDAVITPLAPGSELLDLRFTIGDLAATKTVAVTVDFEHVAGAVDKTLLGQRLELAKTFKGEDFTAVSWTRLVSARDAAQLVYDDPDAAQVKVNQSLQELVYALSTLMASTGGIVDKMALGLIIEEARQLNPADYTPGSWQAFMMVFNIVVGVYENPDAQQQGVNNSAIAMRNAINNVVPRVQPDKTELGALLEEALNLNEADYDEESWEAFVAAREAAQGVYNRISALQADVTAALENLIEAMEKLQEPDVLQGTVVSTIEQLRAALADPAVSTIIFGNDITSARLTDPKLVLNHSVDIYGKNYTLDLNSYSINMESSGKLRVFDLNMKTTDRYGFFSAYAALTSRAGVWNIELSGTTFEGSALAGQRTASESFGYIDSVTFKKNNTVKVTNLAAFDAVVYAKNVTIDGEFSMLGSNNSTFFKSVRSSGLGVGVDAYGSFVILPGADVTMNRSLSSSLTNIYTSNLIEGYENFIFGENSVFTANAGTNLVASNMGYTQTAIIYSGAAKEFTVKEGASVSLISNSSLANRPATHGSTALSLRKPSAGQLDITVHTGAELNIEALGSNAGSRSLAPVVISSQVGTNSGKSAVLVQGELKVYSKNGNGWYYQYTPSNAAGHDSFVVDGGEAYIIADGAISRTLPGEYAALEHFSTLPFDLEVKNSGVMHIQSKGLRAVSLAGATSFADPKKTVTVTGSGSELLISGGQHAISAEGRTDFTLNVLDGGYVSTRNTQDANILTRGRATYNIDGSGSRLEMVRTGVSADPFSTDQTSLYGVIFHDAPLLGPLTINITNGGYMSAENNLGSRATITAQSGLLTNHSINVSGADSTLRVINNNSGNSIDTTLYPVGAIAFAANCSGNINITDGGNFYAEGNSPNSPAIALGNSAVSNLTGVLTLDNPGEVDIRNNADTTNARAIALRGRNYDPARPLTDAAAALIVNQGNIAVWNVGSGANSWPEGSIVDLWRDVTFTASNSLLSAIKPGDLNGTTQFALARYGRIYNSTDQISEPEPVDKEALGALIDYALDLEKTNYTEETWAPFIDALNVAREAYDDDDSTQKQVDEALEALTAAVKALVLLPITGDRTVFTAQKISNPDIRGGIDGIDPDPAVGRHNSYAWSTEVFEQTDGDYLWFGMNRDVGAGVFGFTGNDTMILQLLGMPLMNPDRAGKIYRQRLSDPEADWELMYENRAVTGWRRMIVYNEDLYVVSGASNRAAANYAVCLRFSKDFKPGDTPEIVLWENFPGTGNEYYRAATIFDDKLCLGTMDGKIYMTNGENLQNLTPNALGEGEKSTGWTLEITLSDYGVRTGAVWDLMAFNNSIYAFTSSIEYYFDDNAFGFSVYKITPIGDDYEVKQIVGDETAPYPYGFGIDNNIAASPFLSTIFDKDYVYVTTFANGVAFLTGVGTGQAKETFSSIAAAPQIYRFDANDRWEVVVGDRTGKYMAVDSTGSPVPHVGNQRAGFYLQNDNIQNLSSNQYIWWMAEYEGKLYASTWDTGLFKEHFMVMYLLALDRLTDGALQMILASTPDLVESLNLIFEQAKTVDYSALSAEILAYLRELDILLGDADIQELEIDFQVIIDDFLAIITKYMPQDRESLSALRTTIMELVKSLQELQLDPQEIIIAFMGEVTASIFHIMDRSNPYGFDLFVSEDGKNFKPATVNGLGDQYNYGGRVMISSAHGLFLGTANPYNGGQVWRLEADKSRLYTNGPQKAFLAKGGQAALTVLHTEAKTDGILQMNYDSDLVDVQLVKRDAPTRLENITWETKIETRRITNWKNYIVSETVSDSINQMYDVIITPLESGRQDLTIYFEIDGLTASRTIAITVDLEQPAVDKSALSAKLTAADALKEADYTAASWEAFMTAKEAAQEVYEDEDATQDEIDAALASLTAAITALVPVTIVNETAIFTAQKISNPGIRGGIDGIDSDPAVGRHNSYAWSTEHFKQTDGDYLWIGMNRDIGAGIFSLTGNEEWILEMMGIPALHPTDRTGRIYRQKLSDPDAEWELVYMDPAISGWRRMIVFNEDLYVVAGSTTRLLTGANYAYCLRFPKDFQLGDKPDVVLWENLPGEAFEYYRAATIFDGKLCIGTFDGKIYMTDGEGLQNLTPNNGGAGEKMTGWSLEVNLFEHGVEIGTVWDLMAFNGSLYAFLNSTGFYLDESVAGFSIHKITPNENSAKGYDVKQIVGGASAIYPYGFGVGNTLAASPFISTSFDKDYMYVSTFANGPALLVGLATGYAEHTFGSLFSAPLLFRCDADDNWEVVVGDKSGKLVAVDRSGIPLPHVGNQRAGFFLQDDDVPNLSFNQYIWWMAEHEGKLYAATWDLGLFKEHYMLMYLRALDRLSDGALQILIAHAPDIAEQLNLIFEQATVIDYEAFFAEFMEYLMGLEELLGDIDFQDPEVDLREVFDGLFAIIAKYVPEDRENIRNLRNTIMEIYQSLQALQLNPQEIITALVGEVTASIFYITDKSNPYGFDLFVSEDGKNFKPATVDGLGDKYNYGGRVMISTDHGLFLGTANPYNGGQVWRLETDKQGVYPNGPQRAHLSEGDEVALTVLVTEAKADDMLQMSYDSDLVDVQLVKRDELTLLTNITWETKIETNQATNWKYYSVSETVSDSVNQMYDVIITPLKSGQEDLIITFSIGDVTSSRIIAVIVDIEPIDPTPTVTGVTVNPAEIVVQQGGTQQFGATVLGKNNPSQEVLWSVSGAAMPGTEIDASGLLTVDLEEENGTVLIVTATSVYDDSKSGSATVTVSDEAPVDVYGISLDIEVYLFPTVKEGYDEIKEATITVTNTGNQPTGDLVISMTGDVDAFILSETSIADIQVGGSAAFTVQPEANLPAGVYQAAVYVTGANDIESVFTVSFTVLQDVVPALLQKIEITALPTKRVYTEGESLNLAGMIVTAFYSDGTSNAVTGYSTIPAGGAVLSTPGMQSVIVSYKDNEITRTAIFTVTVNRVIVNPGNNTGGGGGGNDPGGDSKVQQTTPPATQTTKVVVPEVQTPLGPPIPYIVVNPFEDVLESNWFYSDVMYVYNNNLMFGTSAKPNLFSPNVNMTRGMVVTILHRMEGSPDLAIAINPFKDVDGNKWYEKAVIWAAEKGIIQGYGEDLFGPEEPVTREELAIILCNYAKYAGAPLPDLFDYSGFQDGREIAKYADEAVRQLFTAGIVGGKPGNIYDPKGQATRAEFAAMLRRFIQAGAPVTPSPPQEVVIADLADEADVEEEGEGETEAEGDGEPEAEGDTEGKEKGASDTGGDDKTKA